MAPSTGCPGPSRCRASPGSRPSLCGDCRLLLRRESAAPLAVLRSVELAILAALQCPTVATAPLGADGEGPFCKVTVQSLLRPLVIAVVMVWPGGCGGAGRHALEQKKWKEEPPPPPPGVQALPLQTPPPPPPLPM